MQVKYRWQLITLLYLHCSVESFNLAPCSAAISIKEVMGSTSCLVVEVSGRGESELSEWPATSMAVILDCGTLIRIIEFPRLTVEGGRCHVVVRRS